MHRSRNTSAHQCKNANGYVATRAGIQDRTINPTLFLRPVSCRILLYLLLWLKVHLNLDFLGKSSATLNSFLMIVMKLMWQFIDPCRGMMRADFLKLFQSICPEADGECFPTDTLNNCWQHRQRCTGEAENIFTKQPTFPTGLSYYVIRCGCSIARNTG